MTIDLRKKRISVALALALSSSVAALVPLASAQASDRPTRIVTSTKKAYQTEQGDLAGYKASADAADRLTYARLLTRGRIASDSNPLRVPDISAAIEVYRGLLSISDVEIRAKAVGDLADLLQRKGGVENEQEAAALRASLAQPLAGAAEQVPPPADTPVNIEGDLRNRMANGSLDAAFDLLLLQAREKPAEVDTLRSQMLLMANLSALDGDSAVVRLAGRYAGSFDAQQHPEALKSLLVLAAGDGSDSLVGVIEKNREVLLAVLGKEQVREIVWQLVKGGSTRAAELIALDLVDENVFGFDEADGKWAIEALDDVGSYRANYVTAKLYYQGIYVDKDLDRAVAAMENMLAGADAAGQERLVVADRFARMNLSDSLVAKYALPIYMGAFKAGDPSVVARLARVIVSAEKGGHYATVADMPIPPDQLVAELSSAYTSSDLSAGMILGDIYREGRLVAADPAKARTIYEDLRQQYADTPEMQLKLREQLAKLTRQDLEVTLGYAPYYAEVRALAGENNLWAMRELGSLLLAGGPQLAADANAGFDLLIAAFAQGYVAAGPDAANFAIAKADTARIEQAKITYSKLDARRLKPEERVQMAKMDIALQRYEQAEKLLSEPEVIALPTARFLSAKLSVVTQRADASQAGKLMSDETLSFTGDDETLLGFVGEFARERVFDKDVVEPALERLASLADRGSLDAIRLAFNLRQVRSDSDVLSFTKVVSWCATLAERGEDAPLTRVALKVNPKAIDQEEYRQLVETVERLAPRRPQNGGLLMFLAKQYLPSGYYPKDVARANGLIRQAAELGDATALDELASSYYFGFDSNFDQDRAVELFHALAYAGSDRSALELARNYSKGPSSKVTESRALAHYTKAALRGSLPAMTELGRSYIAGAGTAKDDAKGIAWLEKAASLGDVDAMTDLYYYYFISNPTADNEKAERWLDILVENNVPDMIIRKAVLLRQRDAAGNRNDVFRHLERAEELGSRFARRLKNIYIAEDRAGDAK